MISLILAVTLFGGALCQSSVRVTQQWPGGFEGYLTVNVGSSISGGYRLTLTFAQAVSNFQVWAADVVSSTGGTVYVLAGPKWGDGNVAAGATIEMKFIVNCNGDPPSATVCLQGSGGNCGTAQTPAPTPAPTRQPPNTRDPGNTGQAVRPTVPAQGTGKYLYNEVLEKSILFFEAQRSGRLPANNRVWWRGDSAVEDRGYSGEDLTGGWYNGGGNVKFNFPMASTVTLLTWGLIEYREVYRAAGQLDYMLDSIKWPLDYFIKCHTSKNELYGQVGDGKLDHAVWTRPESMTMARPAWKLTPSHPGSDLAAETAAAMAAGSIAFNETDPAYAQTLLRHAEELYDFADKYRGKYSDSITNAKDFYASHSGYVDELIWGGAWLYRATNNPSYLQKADASWDDIVPWGFSWDDKKAGANVLLFQVTGQNKYRQAAQAYLDQWIPDGSVPYTPKGLAWRDQWGSTRYAGNTAFLALVAADQGLKTVAYRDFATKQINYILGDFGRSLVVGFGTNPPTRPHHRASSCQAMPAPCSWKDYKSEGPNPLTLAGALVGGPGLNGHYVDARDDHIANEVACDYNSGFQSAVAGLKQIYG